MFLFCSSIMTFRQKYPSIHSILQSISQMVQLFFSWCKWMVKTPFRFLSFSLFMLAVKKIKINLYHYCPPARNHLLPVVEALQTGLTEDSRDPGSTFDPTVNCCMTFHKSLCRNILSLQLLNGQQPDPLKCSCCSYYFFIARAGTLWLANKDSSLSKPVWT